MIPFLLLLPEDGSAITDKVASMITKDKIFEIFKDESNYPGSICRAQKGSVRSASLFNIVMDLKARRANVTLGRPVEPDDFVELSF